MQHRRSNNTISTLFTIRWSDFSRTKEVYMNVLSSSRPDVSSSDSPWKILRQRPLFYFYLMAFGFSWLAWLPYVLSQQGLGILPFHLPQFALLPGLYLGPILSSFLMAAATAGKPGVRDLLHRLVLWRVNWKWYIFALVVVPIVMILGALILMLLLTGSLSDLKPLALQYYPSPSSSKSS
jgi:hypothetical protein